jgi:hypothetical protein
MLIWLPALVVVVAARLIPRSPAHLVLRPGGAAVLRRDDA